MLRFRIVPFCAAVVALAFAGTAAAADYCVGAAPACSGIAKPANSVGLTQALSEAAASPADDRIVLPAATTFESGSPGFVYFGAAGGRVEIVGQGDSTVLRCASAGTSTVLNVPATPGSSIHGVRFESNPATCTQIHTLLRDQGADVRDSSFSFAGAGIGLSLTGTSPVALDRLTMVGDELPGGRAVTLDDGGSVTVDRVLVRGFTYGLLSRLSAIWRVRDTLIDLGTQDDSGANYPTGVLLANDTSVDHASAELANVTITGTGAFQRGIHLESFHDYTPSPYPTINVVAKNSIIAVTGPTGSHDLYCPNASFDYSVETVSFDHVASNPANWLTDDCAGSVNANPINWATAPLLLDADSRPSAGSSAIDAGDPAFTAGAGELDLAGSCRVVGAAVDLGAYEFGGCPQAPAGVGGGGGAATPLSLRFGKVVGKLRIAKRPKTLRRGTKKSKPRIPVRLSAPGTVTFTLAKKSKRDKAVKGSLKVALPAGQSYLTWSGKWKKKLAAGKYVLTATAPLLPQPVKLNVRFTAST